jgi:hypothetical protein
MVCYRCGEPAVGVCKFCGRGVCMEHHTTTLPTMLSMFLGSGETPKAVAVSNVLWCGDCRPYPEPIDMPEFY